MPLPSNSRAKNNSPTAKQKVAALLLSTLFCIVVLLLGEAFCRFILGVNLRGTSKEITLADPRGRFFDLAKNAHGTAYGVEVFTDQNGFRVGPDFVEKKNDKGVLFLGDSVTFGVGVPEDKTFAGLFRRQVTDHTVYNSGVMGYSLLDYRRVAGCFVPDHSEIKNVYLIYTLNDFEWKSDEEIFRSRLELSLFRQLKVLAADMIVAANQFFITHSALYVYITGMATDPSRQYFRQDVDATNVDEQEFRRKMAPLLEVNEEMKSRQIDFAVVLNPYEMQLREKTETSFAPQRRIEQFLAENGIRYIDTADRFSRMRSSKDAFLFADPMHLSELGHQFVFEALIDDWRRHT